MFAPCFSEVIASESCQHTGIKATILKYEWLNPILKRQKLTGSKQEANKKEL
jgi:hypothetical protein